MNRHLDRDHLLSDADHFRGELTAYSHSILGDLSLAEDAVQETFLLVCRKWQDLEDPEALFPWLRAIVRFKSLESLRRSRRESPQDPDRLSRAIDSRSDAILDQLADETYRQKQMEMVQACLSEIDGRAREVIRRFYSEGQPCARIATDLKLSPEYVRTYLTRIRRKIRSCIASKQASPPDPQS